MGKERPGGWSKWWGEAAGGGWWLAEGPKTAQSRSYAMQKENRALLFLSHLGAFYGGSSGSP